MAATQRRNAGSGSGAGAACASGSGSASAFPFGPTQSLSTPTPTLPPSPGHVPSFTFPSPSPSAPSSAHLRISSSSSLFSPSSSLSSTLPHHKYGPAPVHSLVPRDFHIHYISRPSSQSGLCQTLEPPLLSPASASFISIPKHHIPPRILDPEQLGGPAKRSRPQILCRPTSRTSSQFGRIFRGSSKVVVDIPPPPPQPFPVQEQNPQRTNTLHQRKLSNRIEEALNLTFAGVSTEKPKQVNIPKASPREIFPQELDHRPHSEVSTSTSTSIQAAFRQVSQSSIHPAFRRQIHVDTVTSYEERRPSEPLIETPTLLSVVPRFSYFEATTHEKELPLAPYHPQPDSVFNNRFDEEVYYDFDFRSTPSQGIHTVEQEIPTSTEMGLMRHLTTRSKRPSETPLRTSSPTNKGRPQISLPTELISTTNMLSFSAPSVASMRAAISSSSTAESAMNKASSRTSQHSSDYDSASSTTISEPGLTDASSRTSLSSPSSPVEHRNISNANFFDQDKSSPVHKPSTTPRTSILATEPALSEGYTTSADSSPLQTPALEHDDPLSTFTPCPTPAPFLPRRAPSHSKREHVRLARRRSHRASTIRPTSTVSSVDSDTAFPATSHPFSQELEQLSEAVEEFSGECDGSEEGKQDALVMETMGLKKWRASQYLCEIRELSEGRFDDEDGNAAFWLQGVE